MRQYAELMRKRLLPLTITKAKTRLNKSFVLELLQNFMSQDALEKAPSAKTLFFFFEPILAVTISDAGAEDMRRRGHREQRAQREQAPDQGCIQRSPTGLACHCQPFQSSPQSSKEPCKD